MVHVLIVHQICELAMRDKRGRREREREILKIGRDI